MHQELILVASAILGVILVPSLITVRPPRYLSEEEAGINSPALSSQPAE